MFKTAIVLPIKLNYIEIENEGLSRNERDFIEREDVFNEIDARLMSDNKTVLLHGLSCVGKSSCAIEFIFKKKKIAKFKIIFTFPQIRIIRLIIQLVLFVNN